MAVSPLPWPIPSRGARGQPSPVTLLLKVPRERRLPLCRLLASGRPGHLGKSVVPQGPFGRVQPFVEVLLEQRVSKAVEVQSPSADRAHPEGVYEVPLPSQLARENPDHLGGRLAERRGHRLGAELLPLDGSHVENGSGGRAQAFGPLTHDGLHSGRQGPPLDDAPDDPSPVLVRREHAFRPKAAQELDRQEGLALGDLEERVPESAIQPVRHGVDESIEELPAHLVAEPNDRVTAIAHELVHRPFQRMASYHLDSTPTHSYMKLLYKYVQAEYPYAQLVEGSRGRGREKPELELPDLGAFDAGHWDVTVEYAKATAEDLLVKVTATNRGPAPATLHLLPTLWYRNTWSWGLDVRRPRIRDAERRAGAAVLVTEHPLYGTRWLLAEGEPDLLFTENESNAERLWGVPSESPWVKDAFHEVVVNGRAEADEFYAALQLEGLDDDARNVQRQAFAGLLLSKQYYAYDVARWLKGDPAGPEPPRSRRKGRNAEWTHLFNADVLSMPDKWEYPWYAAWDLAFHCVALALVDPDFAKEQLVLLTREWYMHPNGQLPAYEWAFGDANPPVHAWAAWRVYKIDSQRSGRRDRLFLERVFQKLLLNFTWWVNRKDEDGRNVFEGGFLGLDNIGVFDRSAELPSGGRLEQSDGTSWMGMYCLNMLAIALELARENPAYEGVASKFFEHFVYICRAMSNVGSEKLELWSREDGFFHDVLHLPDGRHFPLRVRSMVGLIPLFAVEMLESEVVDRLPGFKRRMQWFLQNRPELAAHVETRTEPGGRIRRFLSLVNGERLRSVLAYMLDEVATDLSRRLISLFLRDGDGRRPAFGGDERHRTDPAFRDLLLFHEYFHGDDARGLGASHQTGWTALVAKLIQQSGAAGHGEERG